VPSWGDTGEDFFARFFSRSSASVPTGCTEREYKGRSHCPEGKTRRSGFSRSPVWGMHRGSGSLSLAAMMSLNPPLWVERINQSKNLLRKDEILDMVTSYLYASAARP